MSRKIRIALIDSGINPTIRCAKAVVSSYALNKRDMLWEINPTSLADSYGHGSAVASIIFSENSNIEIIYFQLATDSINIDEEGLLFTLRYISENINVDLINISCGITYLYNYKLLNDICSSLYAKGILIISAFDNDGGISYPAALPSVIGVDVVNDYSQQKPNVIISGSIVNVLVPNKFYRTIWGDKKVILKGTSFACGYVTGLLSNQMQADSERSEMVTNCLKSIKNSVKERNRSWLCFSPKYEIKKAVIFPINKESSAILRFKDELPFSITHIYDESLSGRVGSKVNGYMVESYNNLVWSDDFDTIVVSCTSELSALTRKNYAKDILENSIKYDKHIYSLENFDTKYEHFFFPEITRDMIPCHNFNKLHKNTIPVVGVFGTSSKQGKFTLQLSIIKILKEMGYDTGFISTEPSGYLFDADYVFHFGYGSCSSLNQWENIAVLNELVWQVQLKNKDILISGCQSGILNYDNSHMDNFAIDQYSYILGLSPDYSIICVNPHDSVDYIKRSISFINAISENTLSAIVLFPVKVSALSIGYNYNSKELSLQEEKAIISKLHTEFDLPVYSLRNEEDLKKLCESIICFFS